jgi:hypothetical protein
MAKVAIRVAAIGCVEERKKIMTVQEMFEAALAVIKEHNSVVGQGNPGYLDPEKFLSCIKAAGGTTGDRLKSLSYEDILVCMPFTEVKPIALAKDIAKIFRGKENVSSTHEARPVSAKKADKMSLRELIEAYDPEEPENTVGKRLKEISKGERFMVFATGRTLDVDTTLKLLQEVKQGYQGRTNIDINGEIKEVYTLGDLPDNFVDENPLYRGRPLRPDGTCDQTNRSWNGISTNVRQLIRVAMDCGALKDISFERVHDIMDMIMEGEAFRKLTKRYPGAAVEFSKLESLGKLPTLKLVLRKDKGAGWSNRPFDKAKKVQWTANPIGMTFNDAPTYWQFYNTWRKDQK